MSSGAGTGEEVADTGATDDLARAVAAIPWYHTIRLPGGVVTAGRYDTLRALERLPFPESLAGKRCLDIGTSNGFWAFELERRGAEEVVATDISAPDELDWPERTPSEERDRLRPGRGPGKGFELAARGLESQVRRVVVSIYDLSAEELGEFDFVFVGSLLLHLRDPVRALQAVRGVTRGQLLVNDAVSLSLSALRRRTPAAELSGVGENKWWVPNTAGLRRLVEVAGFEVERAGGPYLIAHGPGRKKSSALGDAGRALRKTMPLRRLARGAILRFGVPHAWVLARPSPDGSGGRQGRRPDF